MDKKTTRSCYTPSRGPSQRVFVLLEQRVPWNLKSTKRREREIDEKSKLALRESRSTLSPREETNAKRGSFEQDFRVNHRRGRPRE